MLDYPHKRILSWVPDYEQPTWIAAGSHKLVKSSVEKKGQMDQNNHYVCLSIAFLPAIIGVVLILTGIRQIFIAESNDKVLQGVMGVVIGPFMLIFMPILWLNELYVSMGRGRRARPSEIAYWENERIEKDPHARGVRIGIGIALIILNYFAWKYGILLLFMFM